MPMGFSFVQHKRLIILGSFLVMIFTTGLSGCASFVQGSTTYEMNMPIIICTPNSPLVNIYRATPQPWTNRYFESAFPPFPTPIPPNPPIQFDEYQILTARYAAFQQLRYETERWSELQTVTLKDSTVVDIIVTYLSPELFQAVFLNQVLKERPITYGFQEQYQKALNTIAAREELLFLVTVTMTNNNISPTSHSIKIPIESMNLNNAENLAIAPTHDDHNLELPLDASLKPVFGYLAYPLTYVSASQCEWILDPTYNTNIVITVPYLEVDGTSNKTPLSWTIPYAPLMNSISPVNMAVPTLPPGYDQNLTPLKPSILPPIGMSQTNNWEEFARFVWGQITLSQFAPGK
jgi:hypothetical protein